MWFRSVFDSANSASAGASFRSKKRRPHRRLPAARLQLEALEDRSMLSTMTVTSAADSGAGSLWYLPNLYASEQVY